MTTAPSKTTPAADMLTSTDPFSGEVVGEVPVTPADQIDGVIAAARAAQEAWGGTPLAERIAVLKSAGRHLADEAGALGLLISREQGKTLREGKGEGNAVVSGLDA